MDSVVAFTTKDYAVVLMDTSHNSDIFILSRDFDKSRVVLNNHLLICTGDPGDRSAHGDYLKAQLNFIQTSEGVPMSVRAGANYVRQLEYDSIRDHPVQLSYVYMGYEPGVGPQLFSIDPYGMLVENDRIAQNYSMYFTLAVLDERLKKEMTKEECIDLCRDCATVLNRKLAFQQRRFLIKVVSKDGIEDIPLKLDHQEVDMPVIKE